MIVLATSLMSLIGQVAGTPYIPGGDTPAGTDCSGLASWVANVASGRPAFGSRFNTGNIEPALLARGFHYGSAANSVVIGWNSGHAAVTLPDGTPVSSGESGRGVRVGGGGAYQPQFSHHMYLPTQAQTMNVDAPAAAEPQTDAPTEGVDGGQPVFVDAVEAPAPDAGAESVVENPQPVANEQVTVEQVTVEQVGPEQVTAVDEAVEVPA